VKAAADSPPDTYEFGEFRADASSRVLINRHKQSVPLTPKVFDALLYMLRHCGIVLDKEELMNAIWPDTVVEENNLTQIISTLRRALGERPGKHPYIVTVSGRGYRFVAEVKTRVTGATELSAPVMKTIAVLPFRPLVAENRDPSLEMGMADTLIARLSSGEVVVRPISSVRRYGDLDQDALAAGRELGVDSVLEGNIQRWGDQIRVTVRLVDVLSGVSLWAGTFDEEFTNIFAVQDAISEKVASALELSGEGKRRLTRRYTEDPEAYQLYLRGRHFWNKRTVAEGRKAIECFELAIQKDPMYALAYAGLADCYETLPITGDLPPKDAFPKAKTAALKALEIDDTLAEAHTSLAGIRFWYDWDWAAAESEFKRALQLNEHYVAAVRFYGHFLSNMGRHPEALRHARRALDLDPLSPVTNARMGQFLYQAREYGLAEGQLRNAIELEPSFWMAHLNLGKVYERRRSYTEAMAEFEKACTLAPGNTEAKASLGYAFGASGRRSDAKRVLKELIDLSAQRYVPPYNVAIVHAGLGDEDQALDWLGKAFKDRNTQMAFLKIEPRWDEYRTDPRFVALIERVGLHGK
jgi:DNA-binding winged helix-turn-helix (wHTH) protein/tetratricopeptide (TPR) repeat protein